MYFFFTATLYHNQEGLGIIKMLYRYYQYRYMPYQYKKMALHYCKAIIYIHIYLLNKLPSRVAKCGNEVLIELCQLISLVIDENIPVYLFVALAHTLNKIVSVKYLL